LCSALWHKESIFWGTFFTGELGLFRACLAANSQGKIKFFVYSLVLLLQVCVASPLQFLPGFPMAQLIGALLIGALLID
jgi:hypothetical protein